MPIVAQLYLDLAKMGSAALAIHFERDGNVLLAGPIGKIDVMPYNSLNLAPY
jgi:hypothetical protein